MKKNLKEIFLLLTGDSFSSVYPPFLFLFSFFTFFTFFSSSGIKNGIDNLLRITDSLLFFVNEKNEEEFTKLFLRGTPDPFFFSLHDIPSEEKRILEEGEFCEVMLAHSAPADCCSAGNLLIAGYRGECSFLFGENLTSTPSEGKIIAGSNILRRKGMNLLLYGKRFKVEEKLVKVGIGFFDNAVFMNHEDLMRMAEESLTREDVNDLILPQNSVSFIASEANLKNLQTCEKLNSIEGGMVCVKKGSSILIHAQYLKTSREIVKYIPFLVIFLFLSVQSASGIILYRAKVFDALFFLLNGLKANEVSFIEGVRFLFLIFLPSISGVITGTGTSLLFSNYFISGRGIPFYAGKLYFFSMGLIFPFLISTLPFLIYMLKLHFSIKTEKIFEKGTF